MDLTGGGANQYLFEQRRQPFRFEQGGWLRLHVFCSPPFPSLNRGVFFFRPAFTPDRCLSWAANQKILFQPLCRGWAGDGIDGVSFLQEWADVQVQPGFFLKLSPGCIQIAFSRQQFAARGGPEWGLVLIVILEQQEL